MLAGETLLGHAPAESYSLVWGIKEKIWDDL